MENLRSEGITRGVHLVGDTLYDAALQFAAVARDRSRILEQLGLAPRGYFLATVHRPYNTDVTENLIAMYAFQRAPHPVVFPVHPRTQARIADVGLPAAGIVGSLRMIEPVGYLDMLRLQENARAILTDSGGVQKEAYFFGVPCITLRPETEWVETVETDWNTLAGASTTAILEALDRTPPPVLRRRYSGTAPPPSESCRSLWLAIPICAAADCRPPPSFLRALDDCRAAYFSKTIAYFWPPGSVASN